MCRSCVQNLKIIENTLFEISAVEWERFWKNTLRFKKPYEYMDSNLFKTIKNGKFGKFYIKYCPFEYKISCLDIFGGHFVNLTLFWPKIVVKLKMV
jgi:hypothetical protein